MIAFCSVLLAPAAALHAQERARGIEFAAEPTPVRSLGMNLFLPVDSVAQTTFVAGGRTKVVVQPPDGAWQIQIFDSRSADRALTARAALDEIILQRQQQSLVRYRDGQTRPAVEPFDATLYQRPGERTEDQASGARAYLRANRDAPDAGSIPVTGYTILRTRPGEFVVFQLVCGEATFDRSRPVYEGIVAAAQFEDPDGLDADKTASILAGEAFLSGVSASDLEAVLEDGPIFLRLFNPASTGAAGDALEIGYQRVELRKGQLGELDPRKPKDAWSLAEREWGFLARVEARTLHGGAVIDSEAIFFLARDGRDETWSIVMERKADGELSRSTQTLIRRGPRLTVNTNAPGQAPATSEYDLLEEHYLSGVQRYLMPRLIALKTPEGDRPYYDLAFYVFDPARGRVSLRRDEWEPLDGGGWRCRTSPGEGQLGWTSVYDAEGRLLHRELNPMRRLEPTTRDRLRRLWANKNLPID
jgi:hypothetical protein